LLSGTAIFAGIMLGVIFLLHTITAMAIVLRMLDANEDAQQCAIGGVLYGVGFGSATVPHGLMMVLDIFTEFFYETRDWRSCGL